MTLNLFWSTGKPLHFAAVFCVLREHPDVLGTALQEALHLV